MARGMPAAASYWPMHARPASAATAGQDCRDGPGIARTPDRQTNRAPTACLCRSGADDFAAAGMLRRNKFIMQTKTHIK
jgi:hypothetical protein